MFKKLYFGSGLEELGSHPDVTQTAIHDLYPPRTFLVSEGIA
jgi:hypothetical protein